jgi:hypothetical protein
VLAFSATLCFDSPLDVDCELEFENQLQEKPSTSSNNKATEAQTIPTAFRDKKPFEAVTN